jgi:uncharacterized damage-inducible protein DinB
VSAGFAALLSANARGMLDVLQARIADLGDYDGVASPVATIGWRLEHIAAGITDDRIVQWLAAPVDAPAVPAHATAAEMRAWLASSVDWFCGLVAALGDAHLAEPMGAVAGAFGNSPRAGFVMHMTNEAIHHGAEVGVLRDLWAAGVR